MALRNRVVAVVLFVSLSSPAFAQRPPSRAWIDIDDAFVTPTQSAESYSVSRPLFGEVATSSVAYSTPKKARASVFGGGVGIYRGLGIGMRLSAVDRQTTRAAITLSVPDPVFFNRPHKVQVDTPLERTERALDLAAVYTLPIPGRFALRAIAGRTRVRITQSLIEQITYKYPDASGGVSIVDIAQQTASGYAWGTLVGLDAGFFVLRNVGLGVEVVHRSLDIPTQAEPFSGQPFALSPHRTKFAAGLRIRF